MHVLVVFGNGGGLLVMSFYAIRVNVRMRSLHSLHHTGRIEIYKQTLLIYNWWFFSFIYSFR